MRERGLLTGLMASPRIEKRGTTYRKYRMPISGRARDVLRMPSSIHTQSTETLRQTAASYSLTNRKSSPFSVLGGWFFVFPRVPSLGASLNLLLLSMLGVRMNERRLGT